MRMKRWNADNVKRPKPRVDHLTAWPLRYPKVLSRASGLVVWFYPAQLVSQAGETRKRPEQERLLQALQLLQPNLRRSKSLPESQAVMSHLLDEDVQMLQPMAHHRETFPVAFKISQGETDLPPIVSRPDLVLASPVRNHQRTSLRQLVASPNLPLVTLGLLLSLEMVRLQMALRSSIVLVLSESSVVDRGHQAWDWGASGDNGKKTLKGSGSLIYASCSLALYHCISSVRHQALLIGFFQLS